MGLLLLPECGQVGTIGGDDRGHDGRAARALALAVPLTAKWEGKRNPAY
ncbi:hypothetical protein JMK10_16305 [Rhodovulum sulfidophilum]|nr:hypothetical protein [Rhodovulum sulfidophilum]MBL3575737.1 hypothetical protein [Rhodovulum sulfidophilum]MCF4118327.1 hypothetical protein [Rhodovulum sulfidophilum]